MPEEAPDTTECQVSSQLDGGEIAMTPQCFG